MFTKTVIRQGERIHKQNNIIKQLKEENAGLRDEIEFKDIDRNKLIRKIREHIQLGDTRKELYVNIIDKIKKELDNATNID